MVPRIVAPAPEPSEDDEDDQAPSAAPEPILVAPVLRLPPAVTQAQQILQDALLPAADAGQAAFTGTVNTGLAGVRASVREETAALEETARQERRRVRGSFGRAQGAIEAAIRAAIEAVNGAALDAESEIETWHEYARGDGTLQGGGQAGLIVRDAQQDTRDLGDDKGDEAVNLADSKAEAARTQIRGYATDARDRGRPYESNPGGGSAKARTARGKAAREITRDSATKITENLGDTVRQIRGIGPEVRPQFSRQAQDLADRLADQLPGIVRQADDLRNATIGDIARTADANTTSLQGLQTTYLGDLGALETSVKRSLWRATQASRQALEGAEQTAIDAARAQHDAVAQAGADLVATIVANVSDPRIRAAAAQELAARLTPDVGAAFGTAQGRAQVALAQVLTTFAAAAEQARATIEQAGQEGAAQAGPIAARAQRAAEQQSGELVAQMNALLNAALADGDDILSRAAGSMTDRVEQFRDGFDAALRDLAVELDGKVREAARNAREPLDTFDSRILKAMNKAQKKVEASWLRRQLSSINWGFLAGLLVGILVTIAVIALLGTGIGALVLAGALAGALSVAASTLTEDMIAGRSTDWGQLGQDMVVGAIFGAVGGAVSGGAGAVLARQAATTVARQATIQTGVDFASSIGLGVVQNLTTDQPWDAGLLANMVTSGAMTSRIPAGRGRTINNPIGGAVEGLTNRARAGAVDRGTAYNVTAQERAQSQARFEAAADAVPDARGGEGGRGEGGATTRGTAEGDGATSSTQVGGDRAPGQGDGGTAPRQEGGDAAGGTSPAEGGVDGTPGRAGAEGGADTTPSEAGGEGGADTTPGDGTGPAGAEPAGPPEVMGRPAGGGDEGGAATPGRGGRGDAASGQSPRQRAERAAEIRARAERRTLEAQQRREARTNEAYENRQRHVDQAEARLIEQAQERFAASGDEAALTRRLQDIEQRAAAAREANDAWVRRRMQEIDASAQRQHAASDEAFRQQVHGDETSWPQAGVDAGQTLDLSYTEGGAPVYETGRAPGEAGPFRDMSDADLGRAVDTAIDEAVSGPMGGLTQEEMAGQQVTTRRDQQELFPPGPDASRGAFDPALLPPHPQQELFPGAPRPGYRSPLEPPGPAPYGHPDADPSRGYHGAMGQSGPGGRFQAAEISFVTPDHPTYAVRVGPAGHYVDHIFNTRAEAIAYADRVAALGEARIRELSALPEQWPGGGQGNPVDAVRVDEIPPNTLAQRSGVAPQPESAPGGAGTVLPGGGSQIQLPFGQIGRNPDPVYTTPVRDRMAPRPQTGPEQLELPFPARPTGGEGQQSLQFPEPDSPPAPLTPVTEAGQPPAGAGGLSRPLPGPEGLWEPAGRASWPATIPTVHIKENEPEGTLAEALPAGPTPEQAGQAGADEQAAGSVAPPGGGIDFDIGEHFPEEEGEELMSIQRDSDPAGPGLASQRSPGQDAMEAWRRRVRATHARRQHDAQVRSRHR